MKNVVLNALGEQCPAPVVMTMKALKEIKEDSIIEIYVDNEIAVQNIGKLFSSKKLKHSSEKLKENNFVIRGEVIGFVESEAATEGEELVLDAVGTTIVAIASETMGEGDDVLGKMLLKGFIYALCHLEELPKSIIFYNAGAKLALDNSEVLEDIKSLEDQGVEVLTCGTCLDFFEAKDRLAVGSVSNMYTIVEKLNGATKVIKP